MVKYLIKSLLLLVFPMWDLKTLEFHKDLHYKDTANWHRHLVKDKSSYPLRTGNIKSSRYYSDLLIVALMRHKAESMERPERIDLITQL